MQSVILEHNPYKVLSTIKVNGEDPKKDSKLVQYLKQRFQLWVDKIPALLAEEYNDDEFELTFHGTDLDYQDLLVATRDAEKNGLRFIVKKIPAKEFGEKESDIQGLFKKAQALPFEELQSPAVKDAFEKAFNEEFEVNVVATMSAGKSTLINALLQKKLMPSKNGACTATITRIKDDDDSTFKAVAVDEYGTELESYSVLDYSTMNTLNKNPSISEILVEGNIPFVTSEEASLVLIDTPGPDNARTSAHRTITDNALDQSSKMLVLFVMNGGKLHDDAQDLFLKRIARSMSVGGKQSRERFMFVINKMDAYDEEDDDIAGETIPDTVKYLEEMGIENPNIFPAAAEPALLIRRYQSTFDEAEKQKIYKKLESIAQKMIDQEQLHLEKYPNLAASCRTQIDAELQEAIENGDVLGQALVHTGIRGIEETIRMYVTKYCRPAKITNVVNTFMHGLDSAEAFESTIAEISSRNKEQRELGIQIEKLEKKLTSKEENEKFKKRISSLEITTKLSSDVDKLIRDLQKDFSDFFLNCPQEMDDESASSFVKRFIKLVANKQGEFQVAVDRLLGDDIKEKGNMLLKEYISKLTALSEELKSEGLSIDLTAFAKGRLEQLSETRVMDSSIDSRIETHTETRSRTVTRRARGLNRLFHPSRWFNPEYEDTEYYDVDVKEEVRFISREKLYNSTVAPVYASLVKEKERIMKHATLQTGEIKEYFYEKFDEVDRILAAKASEMRKAVASKEASEAALKKAQILLRDLKEVKAELEGILEI